MGWYFHNAPIDLNDQKSYVQAFSSPDAKLPARQEFILPSSFYLISPNPAWRPFSPCDNARIKSSPDIPVGYRQLLYKVHDRSALQPIYWDVKLNTRVHKAEWVFETTLTPIEPRWEPIANELLDRIKPWRPEYQEEFEKARQESNVSQLSAEITLHSETYKANLIFMPCDSPDKVMGHILSAFQVKSVKYLMALGQKVSTSIVIRRFDWDLYKQRNQVPDRETDEVGYVAPPVTNLTLVFHGIGQKLSETQENKNFTYRVEQLRHQVQKAHHKLGIPDRSLILPISWRQRVKIDNDFMDLNDITPPTLPSVRSKVSAVFFDIPYYMSEHSHLMLEVASEEANRIYDIFRELYPEFDGHVNIIGHSLGAVIAADLLSMQPTKATKDPPFHFNTDKFITIGSPLGFFLYLRRCQLIPRSMVPGSENGGQFGCLAVRNIYNVVHPQDVVAHYIGAAVKGGVKGLETAYVPKKYTGRALPDVLPGNPLNSSSSRFQSIARIAQSKITQVMAAQRSLASGTHVEWYEPSEAMQLLNDNGQVDWLLPSAPQIEILSAVTAHVDYWQNYDFAQFLTVEEEREPGPESVLFELRARKATEKADDQSKQKVLEKAEKQEEKEAQKIDE